MIDKNKELIRLIKDYIACSKYMCDTLREHYHIDNEHLLRAKNIKLIPKEGVIEDGIYFSFHGVGCYFEFNGSSIDIDFGPDDKIYGFDSFRLFNFMDSSKIKYQLTEDDIPTAMADLLEQGVLVKPGLQPSTHLYYFSEDASSQFNLLR